MGCRNDYMEPNEREIEASKLYCIIDDLGGKQFSSSSWSGNHPKAYGKSITQEKLDKLTAKICSRLSNANVTVYSLELQLWWRDHQAADKIHLEEDKEEKRLAKRRLAAVKRLTVKQREALGLDERGNRLSHTIDGNIPF